MKMWMAEYFPLQNQHLQMIIINNDWTNCQSPHKCQFSFLECSHQNPVRIDFIWIPFSPITVSTWCLTSFESVRFHNRFRSIRWFIIIAILINHGSRWSWVFFFRSIILCWDWNEQLKGDDSKSKKISDFFRTILLIRQRIMVGVCCDANEHLSQIVMCVHNS